jgi:hypothetical protein
MPLGTILLIVLILMLVGVASSRRGPAAPETGGRNAGSPGHPAITA